MAFNYLERRNMGRFCVISPNSLTSGANYVTVVEVRTTYTVCKKMQDRESSFRQYVIYGTVLTQK